MKKKKWWIVLIAVLLIVVLGIGCYQAYRFPDAFRSLSDKSLDEKEVGELVEKMRDKEDKKVLVAYFSYSGTTKGVAETIGEKTGADLFEIKTQKEYSNVYTESNSEIRKNEKPELVDDVEQPETYDIVFVGYPVWWHATPAPINTFLESYDWNGKLIIPFCTSGESDIDETMPTFLNSCEGLAVHEGKRIQGTGTVDTWLEELDLGFVADGKAISAGNDVEKTAGESSEESGKVLVAYFSWSTSGNTEKMAKVIQEKTKGDLFEVKTAKPYPTDYEECTEVAKAEKENNERPELAGLPDSIEKYDKIYIGYPIWWSDMPQIMYTFFDTYNFSGKTIIPFTVHGGSGLSGTVSRIQKLEPKADVYKNALSIDRDNVGKSESRVTTWLSGLNGK